MVFAINSKTPCGDLGNPDNGWAVGELGTILRTEDGGATRAAQSGNTSNSLNAVSFVDANTGTAVGNGGIILHTSDGGASWSLQSSGTTLPLNGVSFVDANTGWAVGGDSAQGAILHTGDGGRTWTTQCGGTNRTLPAASDSRGGATRSRGSEISRAIKDLLATGAAWILLIMMDRNMGAGERRSGRRLQEPVDPRLPGQQC